jgi:hypothetical protein
VFFVAFFEKINIIWKIFLKNKKMEKQVHIAVRDKNFEKKIEILKNIYWEKTTAKLFIKIINLELQRFWIKENDL